MSKLPETPQDKPKERGKTARALLAATLLSIPSGASAAVKPIPGMEPVRYPDENSDLTRVAPQDLSKIKRTKPIPEKSPTPEVGEIMKPAEVKICQRGMTHITECFLNPSFRKYLIEEQTEKYEEIVNALKLAIRNFHQLNFTENDGIITIKKRPGGKDIPDNFKIVIDHGLIVEVGGQKLDKSKVLNWEEWVNKFFKFREEVAKQQEIDEYRIPDELDEFGTDAEFNLDKYFLDFLQTREEISKAEAAFLRNNMGYADMANYSPQHAWGNRKLVIRPIKLKEKIIITVEPGDRGTQTILAFSPDGHLYQFPEDESAYTPVGAPDLYAEAYYLRRADKLVGVPNPPPLPSVPETPAEVEPTPEPVATTGEPSEPTKPPVVPPKPTRPPVVPPASPVTETTPPATPPQAPVAPEESPKQQKLGDAVKKNPKGVINAIIADPYGELMKYQPKDSIEKARAWTKLAEFARDNVGYPMFAEGARKLQQDMDKPDFVPPNFQNNSELLSFASHYCPVPSSFEDGRKWAKLVSLAYDYFTAK